MIELLREDDHEGFMCCDRTLDPELYMRPVVLHGKQQGVMSAKPHCVECGTHYDLAYYADKWQCRVGDDGWQPVRAAASKKGGE